LSDRSTFSIIIPIHGDRNGSVPLSSLERQNYPTGDIEVVVIEDDNAKMVPSVLVNTVIHHDIRKERWISRTEGMEAAKNDWFWWLDSDDELLSSSLYLMDYYIRKYPEYKVFHFGGVVYWEPRTWDEKDYDPRTTIRPTPNIKEAEVGMEQFKSGVIASGHFVFHRSVFEDIGGLPKTSSPYEASDIAKEEFPEFKEWFVDTLGNPHGDDYYYFYKMTRKYKSKPLPLNLYLQHVRR
jgi:glycosyltransferase involved in cell wall biosynthesis